MFHINESLKGKMTEKQCNLKQVRQRLKASKKADWARVMMTDLSLTSRLNTKECISFA